MNPSGALSVAPSSSTHPIMSDEDEDMPSSPETHFEDEQEMMNDEITSQLASAGPTGMAAAAAISSTKRRKRSYSFETNPSIRKRQQTRLLRKLRQNIEEYSMRVGQQAVVLVATPGKTNNNFRVFGANPLEDVIKNLRAVIMSELETALQQQAPPAPVDDPTLHELPPLVIDGIPTPVEKMTQAQLRAFIPLMLKYSTGRGKPGWGKESTKPVWWPRGVPWANVRMDARTEDDKQKVSWTHALRQIVINCYKFHGRDDLLPTFTDEEETTEAAQNKKAGGPAHLLNAATVVGQYTPTVVQTISNPDGTVSIIQVPVDPSNPVITLPDGTTAQVQGVAQLEAGQPGVHTLAEVASHHHLQLAEGSELQTTPDGHLLLTSEDGHTYPVSMSGMITVPLPSSMYQAVVANMHSSSSSGDGPSAVQILGTPLQLGGAVVMKSEPGSSHGTLTITPVSNSQGPVLQLTASEVSSSTSQASASTTSSASSTRTVVSSSSFKSSVKAS